MHSIIRKLGGDLYANGTRALIPGPGHSKHDRSVSLFMSANGKIRAHSFADQNWRQILDWLQAEGLITRDHLLVDSAPPVLQQFNDISDTLKRRVAEDVWSHGYTIANTLAETWLRKARRVARRLDSPAFRYNPQVSLKVYDRSCRYTKPAFIAKVTSPTGTHVGTEITYLDTLGRRDRSLSIPRKLVGSKPPGASVGIDQPDTEIVVAEGIPSALSASEYFQLPCHALLGVKSYPAWRPPAGVRRVVIAAETGRAGELYSERLREALISAGIYASVELPPRGVADFNELYGGEG